MDPQKFAEAKFISETHRNIHERRKSQEFKVLVTSLSLYAVTCAAILSGKLDTNQIASCATYLYIAFFSVAASACLYFIPIALANKVNLQEICHVAENQILNSLGIKEPNKNPNRLAYIWQCVVVVLGAFVAAAIVHSQAC